MNKPVTAEVLQRFPQLRVLAVAFTGYGVHDLDACKAAGLLISLWRTDDILCGRFSTCLLQNHSHKGVLRSFVPLRDYADVAVYNVPDYSSNSVAELAIGLTLAVCVFEMPAMHMIVCSFPNFLASQAHVSDILPPPYLI